MAKRKRLKGAFKFIDPFSFALAFFQFILRALFRNLYLFIIFLILFFITKGIHNMLLKSELFTVKEVRMLRIEEGANIVDSSVSLKLEEGINIFKLDLLRCKQQIEKAHSEIKDVRIIRSFPDKIIVLFKKRKPVCQVRSAKYYLVSEDAVVLPYPNNNMTAGLFVITGIYINENRLPFDRKLNIGSMRRALQLIKQIKETDFCKKYRIEEIDASNEFDPVIRLENGIQIKIGRHNFIKKEPALIEVLKDLESKGLRPRSIDLRFEDVIVTPK